MRKERWVKQGIVIS